MVDFREHAFETELCEHLAAHGWLYSTDDTGYDRDRALFPDDVRLWLEETQPDELAKVTSFDKVLDRIVAVLDQPLETTGGTLNLLRRGFATGAASFDMAQLRPETEDNPETTRRYAANRLRVVRQVHYSRHNNRSIDLVLFLNGIPVATAELKTDFTQSSGDAVEQYRRDRTPRDPATRKVEPLLAFGRRALVHFAVSSSDVQMTTRLDGAATRFLPFNAGDHGGAGNAANPHGSPTSYLWERVWQRDAWLRVLLSFVHLTDGGKGLLFPRFHQWEAVTTLVDHARANGPGQCYLVQHSAGSGKSNSIAWLTHQLSTLHDAEGRKVFRSVIVVTDRNVLDTQLRETIRTIDHRAGTITAIGDETARGQSKSAQLADALRGTSPIITVTIQTFPFVAQALGEAGLEESAFAIVADEAHSSQTGGAAREIRSVLAGESGDSDEEVSAEDALAWQMTQRVRHEQLSYFAFTATPKNRTLELFGTPDDDGKPRPFHLYTMRQAIEEGFILDVLRSYTPYDLAFRLSQQLRSVDGGEHEVEVDQSRASAALMRWVRLHPTNIAQKVQVVVEHFRANVAGLLEGRAKAMVVTGSRKEAVRWKLAMDKYVGDAGDVRALVAFSGGLTDPESGLVEEATEHTLNDLGGRPIEQVFAGTTYDVMIVAEKFQTGFDQPLLVAMYVDKRLSGVTAVQTLSRLNRTAPGKDTTYVLDFVNDPEEIVDSFKPYYEEATLAATTDPDLIHDLRAKLDGAGVYTEEEVDAVAAAWLSAGPSQQAHEQLIGLLTEPKTRFESAWARALADDDSTEQERLSLFHHDLDAYVRLYDFLCQIVDYGQTALEKRAIFFRLLSRVLERGAPTETIDLSDVVLAHVAHRRNQTRALDLGGDAVALQPLTGSGSGQARDPVLAALGEVIRKMNEVFDGGAFDDTDIGALTTHVVDRMLASDVVRDQVRANTVQQVEGSPALREGFNDALVEAFSSYGDMVKQLFDDERKRVDYFHSLIGLLYRTAERTGA